MILINGLSLKFKTLTFLRKRCSTPKLHLTQKFMYLAVVMKVITVTIISMSLISMNFWSQNQVLGFRSLKTEDHFQVKDGDIQQVFTEIKCLCLEVETKKIEMNFILIPFKRAYGIYSIILTNLLEFDDDVIQCL